MDNRVVIFGIITLILMGFVVMIFFRIGESSGNFSYNQNVTIKFEYNGSIVSNSASQSVYWRKNNYLGSVNGAEWLSVLKGNLPYIRLDDGSILVALLIKEGNSEYARNLINDVCEGAKRGTQSLQECVSGFPQKSIMSSSELPIFALLDDPGVPERYSIISPSEDGGLLPNLRIESMYVSYTEYSELERQKILLDLPYLEDTQFQYVASNYNLEDNPWLPPTHVIAR